MNFSQEKVDEMTLALLYLVSTKLAAGLGAQAWKGIPVETMNRLHGKGWIHEPKSKSPTLHLTEVGYQKSKQLFEMFFGLPED